MWITSKKFQLAPSALAGLLIYYLTCAKPKMYMFLGTSFWCNFNFVALLHVSFFTLFAQNVQILLRSRRRCSRPGLYVFFAPKKHHCICTCCVHQFVISWSHFAQMFTRSTENNILHATLLSYIFCAGSRQKLPSPRASFNTVSCFVVPYVLIRVHVFL